MDLGPSVEDTISATALADKPFIERDIHPTIIVGAYYRALEESLKII
jgi:hypothetical protein